MQHLGCNLMGVMRSFGAGVFSIADFWYFILYLEDTGGVRRGVGKNRAGDLGLFFVAWVD